MRRQYFLGIILSLAIILCIVQVAGTCLASSGGLPVPPLPPATLPQTTGQPGISTPVISPMAAPQDQQASTPGKTVSMDQYYAPPSATPVPQIANESQTDSGNTNTTLSEMGQQASVQEYDIESPVTAVNNTVPLGQADKDKQSINSLAGNLIGKLLTLFMG